MELSKIIGITQNSNILLAKIKTNQTLNTILSWIVSAKVALQNSFIEDGKIVFIAPMEEFNKVEQCLNGLREQNLLDSFEIKANVSHINIVGKKLLKGLPVICEILFQI
jgi:aspartokinase